MSIGHRYWKITIIFDNIVKLPNGKSRVDKDAPYEYVFYGPPKISDVQDTAIKQFRKNYPESEIKSIKVEATKKP